jgi:hypothetical protein
MTALEFGALPIGRVHQSHFRGGVETVFQNVADL